MARKWENSSSPKGNQRKGNLFCVKLSKYPDIPSDFTLQILPFFWFLWIKAYTKFRLKCRQVCKKENDSKSNISYHLITTLPQVNPLPKAAITTISPSLILPFSQASQRAIGIDAAVVFPYF